MSSLGKIQIQGIRSFGPENPQAMKFYSPLTLIVGQNGSGKTTLIECLRYVCTGEMPSTTVGLSKNANFAHDLNISGIVSCNSQVKLKFFDVNNEPIIATRNMHVTKKSSGKSTKIECKTIEGVISKLDKRTNQMNSVQSKCTDMNREMTSLLGVGDAVLNNVIFCHQEDSTWPLSEPKVLKMRFDEIFSATKYMKALETMRNYQKELARDLTGYKSELTFLRQIQEQAKLCRQQIRDAEETLQKYNEDAARLQESIAPLKRKLDQIGKHRNDVDRLRGTLASLKAEKATTEKSIVELRSHISEPYLGGIDELKDEIERFEVEQQRILVELHTAKVEVEQLAKRESALEKQKGDLFTKRGKFDAEMQNHCDQIEKRDKQITEHAAKFGYAGFSNLPLSDTNVAEFLRLLKQKETDLEDEMACKKAELDQRLQKAKTESERASNDVAANRQAVIMKEDTVSRLKKEIDQVESFLAEMDNRQARLTQLNEEITRLESELASAVTEVDEDKLRNDIAKLQAERIEIDTKVRSVQDELRVANQHSSLRMELDLLLKEKASKSSDLEKFLDKHRESLNEFFSGGTDPSKLRDLVEDEVNQRRRQLHTTTQKLAEKKSIQKSKENERNMRTDDQKAKEKELQVVEERICQILNGGDVKEELENIRESLDKLQFDKGTVDGSENIFKSYIKKLENRPCCPLCERNFDDRSEANTLSDKLKREVKLLPDRAFTLSQKIEEQQKRQADLLELRPEVERARRLKENDIPALRKKIEELNSEIRSVIKEIVELDSTITIQTDEEHMIRAIYTDCGQIDALHKEIQRLQGRISMQEAKLRSVASSRSVSAIEEEMSGLQMVSDDIVTSLTMKQDTLSKHGEKTQRLSKRINDLTKEKLEITDAMQQRIAYDEKKSSLTAQRDGCKREIEDLKLQAPSLKEILEKVRHNEKQRETEKENCLRDYQQRLQTLVTFERNVADLNESIRRFQLSGKKEELNRCNQRIDDLESELAGISRQRKTLIQENEEKERCSTQSRMKLRELNDNLKVKEKETVVERLESEITKNSAEFDRLGGLATGGREYDTVVAEHARLSKELHGIEGKKTMLEKNLEDKHQMLRKDGYADADEKLASKLIQYVTTDIASNDLTKYYKALDSAIIKYHSSKMEAINDVLREYWQKIYKHNDIDYIAIKSDETEGTDKRRAYNYRVVMRSGGAEVDMRGRCSAGQKMLASILIRIALAEVFCVNCGILALDEPTTNLDALNIQGLAEALVELIQMRQQQKNFQMVLITHDENFVRMLLQGYPMETHYRVMKDDRGYSQICETRTSELE